MWQELSDAEKWVGAKVGRKLNRGDIPLPSKFVWEWGQGGFSPSGAIALVGDMEEHSWRKSQRTGEK